MKKYAYTNGKILDGTRNMKVKEGLCVLTEGDKITGLVPADKIPAGCEMVDLQGGYLMPGLINMHVHLAGNGKPQKKQRDNEALTKKLMGSALSRAVTYRVVAGFAKTELMSGVTTIRTVGGLGDFDTRLRDEIADGKRVGPRILAANRGISVPGGHMAGSVAVAADSIEAALAQIEQSEKENVDLIKLMITGGVLDAKAKGVPGELKMAPEMVKAVCEKAHKKGYKVAAHVESPEGVKVALANGVDSIEHGAKADEEMIRLFQEHKAFLCTTISPALPYALFERSVSNASEVEQYKEMSFSMASFPARRLLWRMAFLSFLAMTSDAPGLRSMISGGSFIISRNMWVSRIPSRFIPQPDAAQSWPGSAISRERSRPASVRT